MGGASRGAQGMIQPIRRSGSSYAFSNPINTGQSFSGLRKVWNAGDWNRDGFGDVLGLRSSDYERCELSESVQIKLNDQKMGFRLPCDWKPVFAILTKNAKIRPYHAKYDRWKSEQEMQAGHIIPGADPPKNEHQRGGFGNRECRKPRGRRRLRPASRARAAPG